MAFFSNPTNKRPQTRPQSAPPARRKRTTKPLKTAMPFKGDKFGPKPRSGK